MKTGTKPRKRTDTSKRRQRQSQRNMSFGTWNVLSWYRAGAARRAVQELERLRMDITAIQEIRWPDSGDMKISKSHLFYSGSQQNRHEFGTGFVIREDLVQNVISFKPISDRLCYLRLKSNPYNCSFISAHAPTEDKDDTDKEAFYEELETLLDETPKQDMIIIGGDFNAQVGKEQVYKPTIGQHSLHTITNDNGARLIQCAAGNNMLVKSTMFEHKSIHKQTWISNDGRTRNQIDHIIIDARHGSNCLDVRSLRGADGDSDHILVRAKLRIRISNQKAKSAEKITRWNTEKLKCTQITASFQEKIQENIQQLEREEHEDNIQTQWDRIETAVTRAAEECLGRKTKKKTKDWFDEECKNLIKQRERTRIKKLQDPSEQNTTQYKEIRKKTSKTIRTKKRTFEQETLKEMENNRNNNKVREFYNELSSKKKGFRPRTGNFLKKEDDTLITNEREILDTWRNYFATLLNTHTEKNTPPDTHLTVDLLVELPSHDEIKEAIKSLKNNKAPGSDGIPSELLKSGGDALHQQLYQMIATIWQEEQLPEKWKECVIIPIHKKGNKMVCANYRGISLLNTAYKILARVLLKRITPFVENTIGEYQCGFRRNRSTIDQIFTIRQMLEKAWEFNQQLHNLFIDFKQAYDSIIRVELWRAMTEISIPQKLIRLTRMCVENPKSCVRVGSVTSKPFRIASGLKQGDAMSPVLFNIALDKAVREAKITMQMFSVDGPRLLIAFADDIDIIAKSTIEVKEQFVKFEKETNKMGLNVNENKTKYMCVTRQPHTGRDRIGQNMTIGDLNFERVRSFKYLGAIITDDNDIQQEIKARIIAGNRCMYSLMNVFRSKYISRKSKIQIYKTVIRPIVLYGSETWTMIKSTEEKLRCFERKVLRKIYGPTRDEDTQRYRIRTNRELKQLYKQPDIVKEAKSQRLRWAGHIRREPDNRWAKLAWQTNPQGRRPPGRPRTRWRDNIEKDLNIMGIEWNEDLMMDRKRWRQIVQSAKTHEGL